MIMKHSGFVFGMASLVAACAAQPRHPLYNGDSSPACGNIGQVGRCDVANVHAMHAAFGASATITPVRPLELSVVVPSHASEPITAPDLRAKRARKKHDRQHRLATPRAPLLVTFATDQLALQVQRPRLADEDVAVGNVMSKGGSHTRRIASQPLLTAPTPAQDIAPQRPLVTDDDDFAVGNMTTKKKR